MTVEKQSGNPLIDKIHPLEFQLYKLESRYKTLFGAMKRGVVYLDKNLVITEVNAAAIRVMGLTPDNKSGIRITDKRWNTVDSKGTRLNRQNHPVAVSLNNSGEIKNLTVGIMNQTDRKIRWLNINTFLEYLPQSSEPSGVLLIFEDLTRQKKIIEALKNSEEKYRGLIDNSLVGVYQTSLSGDILYANNAFAKMLEYDSQIELMKTNSKILYSNPDDRKIMLEDLRAHNGIIDNYEVKLRTKKGKDLFALITASLSDKQISGMVNNITDRKNAENEILRSKENLTALIENKELSIWSVDRDFRVLTMNSHFRNEFNQFTGKEIEPNMNFMRILPNKSRKIWKERFDKAFSGEKIVVQEKLSDHGNTRYWEISLNPILHNGETMGASIFSVEITEKKKAEAELKKMMSELERSNNDLEQFAYIASHDLQEPLRKIKSFSELLANRYRGNLDEKANHYIDYITGGAKRMQNLINDLLQLSRITTRGKPFEPTDINSVLQNVLDNLEISITESGAIIEYGKMPVLIADNIQLTQLFQNLVSNAIKFRNKDTIPEIHIDVKEKKEYWQFEVRDNGLGIDMQYAGRIFIIFQRLHTRDEYSGTGIGLALCKKIVERHGGEIWLKSKPGEGSKFRFTLRKARTITP